MSDRTGEGDYERKNDLGQRLGNWFTWRFTLVVVVLTGMAAASPSSGGGGGAFYLLGTFLGVVVLASFGKYLYIK